MSAKDVTDDIIAGVLRNDSGRTTDINGLRGCPNCQVVGEVRPQHPPDDDGIVRRVYLLCFNCHTRCPDLPEWKPVHWTESGSALFAPTRDHWNAWVQQASPQPQPKNK